MNQIETLSSQWMAAKEAERVATQNRREIEDELIKLLGEPKEEGTFNHKSGTYKISVVQRMRYQIDSDALQEAALEAGLHDHLSDLFRWKPEINMRAWRDSDPSITRALSVAITATPSKPSFKIESTEN